MLLRHHLVPPLVAAFLLLLAVAAPAAADTALRQRATAILALDHHAFLLVKATAEPPFDWSTDGCTSTPASWALTFDGPCQQHDYPFAATSLDGLARERRHGAVLGSEICSRDPARKVVIRALVREPIGVLALRADPVDAKALPLPKVVEGRGRDRYRSAVSRQQHGRPRTNGGIAECLHRGAHARNGACGSGQCRRCRHRGQSDGAEQGRELKAFHLATVAPDVREVQRENYDFGYRNLGRGLRLRPTNAARAWVDRRFLAELRRVCAERFAARALVRCRVRARAMHAAVRLFNPPWS